MLPRPEDEQHAKVVQRLGELVEMLKAPRAADPGMQVREMQAALEKEVELKCLVEDELASLRSRNTVLQREVHALTSQTTTIRNQRAAIAAEANDLRLAAADAKAALAASRLSEEALKNDLEQKRKYFEEEREAEALRAQSAAERSRSHILSLEARQSQLTAQVEALRMENESLREQTPTDSSKIQVSIFSKSSVDEAFSALVMARYLTKY